MPTRTLSLILVSICFGALLTGCSGGGGDDGVKSSVSNAMSDENSAAVRVHGDWSKLTDEERKKFIATFGDEAAAKKMMKMMANPPNKKYTDKGK